MSILYKTNDGDISLVAGSGNVPIGSIIPFMGKVAPIGWLLCDGSRFDKDNYSYLYNVLESDVLPDLRNKTVFGAGDKQLGTATEGGLPNITGSASSAYFNNTGSEGALLISPLGGGAYPGQGSQLYGGRLTLNAKSNSTLYKDNQDYVEPASVIVNFIIKAQ